jgi:hypothetical protein
MNKGKEEEVKKPFVPIDLESINLKCLQDKELIECDEFVYN